MSEYIEFEHPATGTLARWHGGEYIDLGHIAERDSHIRNNLGQPSHYAGEFVAYDVINVWDANSGTARIPFTAEALAEAVNDHFEDAESVRYAKEANR